MIARLTPLKEVLAGEQYICVARVAALDPDKPALVLTVEEDLKDKLPARRLAIDMTGDAECKKAGQTPKLFKRLAKDLPVVVFASRRGQRFTAFVYTNGTWFQTVGVGEPDSLRWSLAHAEPYLRRTFKGTTAELRQVILDGLANRKPPPAPDPKAEPGLGPEVGAGPQQGARRYTAGPLVAVIPTVFVMGPLALLATLLPAVFGGFQRRWLALLAVVSLNASLYVLHALYGGYVDAWWSDPRRFWLILTGIALLGFAWSWRRWRRASAAGETAAMLPRRWEVGLLHVFSLIGLLLVLSCGAMSLLADVPWKELAISWAAIWVGAAYARYLCGDDKPRLPSAECMMLAALACSCAGLALLTLLPAANAGVVWTFEPPDRGSIDSSPLVDHDHIYVGAAHRAGLGSFGAVYCVDVQTGALRWKFDDGGNLRPVFSSPRIAGGKLYIGEGYHQDGQCRLFCLDAATGRKVWEFATDSHVESTPCVKEGSVYFGAGDDGVYCLDATTGEKRWQFKGAHADSTPAVDGGWLYAGSGYGNYEVFCLGAADGRPRWRVPLDLPAFGSPTVFGGNVYFGLGNGNLLASADSPAGAVICLNATTGERLWQHPLPDAVHGGIASNGNRLYCGCRDGHVCCLDAVNGNALWTRNLGSPIVTTPVVVVDHPIFFQGPRSGLYVLTSAGRLCCLNPFSGKLEWRWDVPSPGPLRPQFLSSPALWTEYIDHRYTRRLIFGAGLTNLVTTVPRLYCVEEPANP